ncbi:MAG: DinB family protein [Dehalococcoidia bacterium]
MTDELARDLEEQRNALDAARKGLLEVVSPLSEGDLERGRRGGWTVQRVLEHVIWSEHMYARLVTHLRGATPQGEMGENTPTSIGDAIERLAASRAALLAALDGVDEESFYRLQQIGHEEYSVISLLENTVSHDREHATQVREILAAR